MYNQMSKEEFFEKLSDMYWKVFLPAIGYYRLYLALWPTDDTVDVLNKYREFFYFIRGALWSEMILQTAKLFDTGEDTISLSRLLKVGAADQQNLMPSKSIEDIRSLRKQLKSLNPLVDKIKTIRNQAVAHLLDSTSLANEESPGGAAPTIGEMEHLFATVKSVIDGISYGHNHSYYASQPVQDQAVEYANQIINELKT